MTKRNKLFDVHGVEKAIRTGRMDVKTDGRMDVKTDGQTDGYSGSLTQLRNPLRKWK